MKSRFMNSISSLYRCNETMSQNASYVLNELRTLPVPEESRAEIETTFKNFESTLYDVRQEIRNLEDKLGLHTGQGPFDPSATNSDSQLIMDSIRQWVDEAGRKLDQLVRKLWTLSDEDPNHYILVSTLVTESVKNIFQAQAEAKSELDLLALMR